MFTAKYTGISLISIPYRRKLCREKLTNFYSASNIFPDEKFYPKNPREFRKSQVEGKMTSNSLCKMGKSGKISSRKKL